MRIRSPEFGLSPHDFHGWADRYLERYRELPVEIQDSVVAFMLLCRTIELELKGWHLLRTERAPFRDEFRHDLIASYRKLPARLQILSNKEVVVLDHASAAYTANRFEELDRPRAGKIGDFTAELKPLEKLTEKIMTCGDRFGLGRV